ncbi:competence protein CoiA [Chitinophaga niabensis]|uniref:Competence protein CoiA-like family protein n=1 Tax=Chitinophaga niabensis TaxID=536979 RepID=A0A1N6E460_9BACT|nr:competence protein CoiA family protein [Chitinophaga niabensis]SIN77802.1 Competence protein CoiA-like family protein [Chitinophaga niabensis]
MRFALINNEPIEAAPGLQGNCRGCGRLVIAKCGTVRVHHWAHQTIRMCDSWWEPETEWHRSWKNNFSREWQEVFMPDVQSGEKHIADVRTEHGLVLEFQHSHIKPEERTAREKFYRNMVWVVDGTRLKRDYTRFLKGKKDFRATSKPGIFMADFPDECFPKAWLNSSVPVIFDFKGAGIEGEPEDPGDPLYCLFPYEGLFDAYIAEIPKNAFINTVQNGEWGIRVQSFMNEVNEKRKHQERLRQNPNNGISYRKFIFPRIYIRRRRF